MAHFTKLVALFVVLSILEKPQVLKARLVVIRDSINVVSPLELSSKHDGAIGMFRVQDGQEGFAMGFVVYPSMGSRGCKPSDEGNKPFNSTIVLLDRGGILHLHIYNIYDHQNTLLYISSHIYIFF